MRHAKPKPASGDFFVSYAKPDEEWAKWVGWELQEAGHTVIVQAWHFAPGQDFVTRMRRALERARHVVAIYSPDYFASRYASAEFHAAFAADPMGLKQKLIPVRVRHCKPPVMFRSRIYIDLVGKKGRDARKDLLEGIAAALATGAESNLLHFDEPPRFPGDDVRPGRAPVPSATPIDRGAPASLLFVGMDIGRGLRLREQGEGIRRILEGARGKRTIRIIETFDATAEGLPDLLNKHLPAIVHLSGNQNGGRVLLRSTAGGVTTIPANALAGLLKSLDGAVKLAIVDTCSSLPCARAIVGSVDFAMGVRGKPYDDDATAFYQGFYRALAAGRSLEAAAGQATAAHGFRGVPKQDTPQLCVRRGADPSGWSLSRLSR